MAQGICTSSPMMRGKAIARLVVLLTCVLASALIKRQARLGTTNYTITGGSPTYASPNEHSPTSSQECDKMENGIYVIPKTPPTCSTLTPEDYVAQARLLKSKYGIANVFDDDDA
nr:hypothetical protein [uncultured Bartonella sp.]